MNQTPRVPKGAFRTSVFVVLLLLLGLVSASFFISTSLKPSSPVSVDVPREAVIQRDGRLQWKADKAPMSRYMIERYSTCILSSHSRVSHGLLHGVSKGWYTNGMLQVREHFVNGTSEGLRQKWYETGQPMCAV